MYRLDAVWDRIYFNSIKAENAVNQYKVTSERFREKVFMNLLKDFKTKETQLKIHKLINRPADVKELKLMFSLIDKHLNQEKARQEKGLATHLMAVLLNNFNSKQLWKKVVELVDVKETEELDKFLKRQSVMKTMSNVIENYLSSLVQVGDEFLIDCSESSDIKQTELCNSLQVHEMIIVIHHLLFNPKTSGFFHQRIFETFDLSPSCIAFLKLSLRTLSL